MAKLADNVKDSTTTTGTGTLTLVGTTLAGYRPISAAYNSGDTAKFRIDNFSAGEWEINTGTFSAGTLTRNTPILSSNADAKVNFSAGTKYISIVADVSDLLPDQTGKEGGWLRTSKGSPYFDTTTINTVGYNLSNYSWAVADTNNKLALSIDKTGAFCLPVIGKVGAAIQALLQKVANLQMYSDTTNYNRSNYFWAVTDTNNKLALSIDKAGHVIFGNGGNINTRVTAIESTSNILSYTNRSLSGYSWVWKDSVGKVCGGIDNAGNLISKGLNVSALVSGSNNAAIAAIIAQLTPSGYWWYGDSLTTNGASLWPTLLSRPVTVKGVGGQTAQQIAARFGGQVPQFTVTGNTIPASGSVAVTSRSIELITAQNTFDSFTGKLFGIPGTYTSDAATYWTFTRTNAGSAITIDPNTPFLIDITDARFSGTCIFWYGRNNVGTSTFNADVKQTLSDSISALRTLYKRFVIVSVLNFPGEIIGTGSYNMIEQLNTDLKNLYPRNFVDVLNLLRRSGDGSANDIADASSGIIPRSLRNTNDGHLNTAGSTIVGTRVSQFLNQMGW